MTEEQPNLIERVSVDAAQLRHLTFLVETIAPGLKSKLEEDGPLTMARTKPKSERITRLQLKHEVDDTLYKLGFQQQSWGWHEKKLQLQIIVAGTIKTVDLRYCLWTRALENKKGLFIAWSEGMALKPRLEMKEPKIIEIKPTQQDMFNRPEYEMAV